ncbi:MAG: nitroreductase family protein [Acidimicrobiales bacterium]
MELGEAVRRRRMTRCFSEETVEAGAVDRIVASALSAPSAGFTQGVEWLVLTTAEERRSFFEAVSEEGFLDDASRLAGLRRAPVVLLPVAAPGAYVGRYAEPDKRSSRLYGLPASRWPVPYWTVDAAFATMLVLLAAEDEGLGALFFHLGPHRPRLEAAFSLPSASSIIGAVALGHPCLGEAHDKSRSKESPSSRASPRRRARRPLGEMVHRGSW